MLDVSAEVAAERRGMRSGSPELYEVSEIQAALADLYGKIDELFPNDRIVHVDAHQSVEGVAEAIWTEVMKLRGEST